jgi:hypothetical protein
MVYRRLGFGAGLKRGSSPAKSEVDDKEFTSGFNTGLVNLV